VGRPPRLGGAGAWTGAGGVGEGRGNGDVDDDRLNDELMRCSRERLGVGPSGGGVDDRASSSALNSSSNTLEFIPSSCSSMLISASWWCS
jgi:hypothetical protein